MDESYRFSQKMGIPDDVVTNIRCQNEIVIKADDDTATTMEGQVMLEVVVNLLSRLFSRIRIEVSNLPATYLKADKPLAEHLQDIAADSYQWDPNLSKESSDSVVIIVVGSATIDEPAIYIDADGWVSYVGTMPSGLKERSSSVPIGSIVSACIGVAEVFKKLFGPYINSRVIPIEGQFWLNTLTYRDDKTNIAVPLLDLDAVTLFGCGSVGSSLLYTLGFMPKVIGNLHLVDRDVKVDFKNLQRYSLLTVSDVMEFSGVSKTRWAEAKIKQKHPNLNVIAFDGEKGTVNGYLNSKSSKTGIRLAISAVDNIEARIDIADCLALRSINAGTGDTTLTITRHGFVDGHACLACSFVGQAPDISWFQQIEQRTGITIDRVAFLMQGKAMLEMSDLHTMQNNGFINDGQFTELLGTDLASLVNRNLYSAVSIQHQGKESPVTAPFISLMAGALLAGEMIKETIELQNCWEKNKYRTDMMSLPELYTNSVAKAGTTCLCANGFRRGKYRMLWQ